MNVRTSGPSTGCEWLQETMSAKLDGEAAPDELVALDAHLAACPDCCDAMVRLERQHRSLRRHRGPGTQTLVPGVLAKVIEFEPETEQHVVTRRARWALRALASAALVALVLMSAALTGAFEGLTGPDTARPVARVAAARPAVAGGSSVLYLLLDNNGASDVVIEASSPVADIVEFHHALGHSGEAVMNVVTTVALGSRAQGAFAGDDVHLMLSGLRRDLRPGDVVPVRLTLRRSGAVTINATVRA
jgi:copper(I)-binding protein